MTPPRLGRPAEGSMRRLTVNEAVVTEFPRSTLVAVVGGETLLFRALCGGSSPRYGLVPTDGEATDAYAELERFWREG